VVAPREEEDIQEVALRRALVGSQEVEHHSPDVEEEHPEARHSLVVVDRSQADHPLAEVHSL